MNLLPLPAFSDNYICAEFDVQHNYRIERRGANSKFMRLD